MTTTATTTDTKTELLAIVDDLTARERQWARDDRGGDRPPESFDDAVERAGRFLLAMRTVPNGMGYIVAFMADFCLAWIRFCNGDQDHHNFGENAGPPSHVWTALNQMREHREKLEAPVTRRRESVTLLVSRGTPPLGIAKIFGTRNPTTGEWQGPFFDRLGRPDSALINQQHRHECGDEMAEAVLSESDFVETIRQPDDLPLNDVIRRIIALGDVLPDDSREAQAAAAESPADKGSPEELARGGAYPRQVKKAFPHLTDAEVSEVFTRINRDSHQPMAIPPVEVNSDYSLPSPVDEELTRRAESLKHRQEQQRQAAATDDPPADQPEADPPAGEISGTAELRELVSGIVQRDPSLGPGDISRKIYDDQGISVDARSIQGILRKLREEQAQQAY